MSRLEQGFRNVIYALGNSILSSILGFISRTVFIYKLGETYLGLSGLLNNVFGMLTISELGISTAIGFSLYKPLAEKDYDSVSALMSLYRKAYKVIGSFVLISGIAIYPFLDFFIAPEEQPFGITYAYYLFLLNIVLGYFVSYKTTLINSDNKGYEIVPISALVTCIQTVLQIGYLLMFPDYFGYLTIQIFCTAVIAILQNRYITTKYSQVDFYSKRKLEKSQKQTIKKNISGLIIAKIGDYLVNSTDNLIITKVVSLSATGVYSNYLLIRNIVNGYISAIFGGITAGMGNVVAKEGKEKKIQIFNTMFFCAFLIYSFEATCFMCLFNPFIGDIWIGWKYTFSDLTVAIIVLNNFLTGLRIPIITMKNAAGVYLEDAWVPFGFSAVNLIASVIFAKYLGIVGVFLGTILGSICTADWYRPLVIYRNVFEVSVKYYFRRYILYLILGILEIGLSYGLCILIPNNNKYVSFVIKIIISSCIPIIINYICFRRTCEFQYFFEMIKKLVNQYSNKTKRR